MTKSKFSSLPTSMLRLVVGSVLGIILLLILGTSSFHYFSESRQARQWVDYTHNIISRIQSLQAATEKIESNSRGYLLTGDKSFLKLYRKDKTAINEKLGILKKEITKDSPLWGTIPKLEASIQKRLELIELGIIAYENKPELKKLIPYAKRGQLVMVEISAYIEELKTLERKLLSSRLEITYTHSKVTERLILVFIILTIISLLTFAILNFRDLRKRYKTEAELIVAEKAAQGANKTKSDFLANMSHEIRTPLNAIIGMADLLVETPLNTEQKRYVQIFQRSGQGLLNLINDILDLSKVEAGQLDLDNADFALSELLDQISDLVAIKAHQKGIEFVILIDPEIPEYFVGDPNRIRQVILNLVNNSIKFTEQGEVVVSVKGKKGHDGLTHLEIDIKDTGIGMTPEQTAKVFERFTQADEKITTKFGGTGLGLSISKKLIELMGGTISTSSTFGVGTTMKIELPLPLAENNPVQARIELIAQFKGKKALIVDDNSNNRLIIRQILSKQEVIIDEAENGTMALDMITAMKEKSQNYDFILLDGRMPDIDGFTVAERIRERNLTSHSVLMMLTSDQRAGDIEKSKKLGIKGYLVKPFSYKEFSSKLNSALIQRDEISNSSNASEVLHSSSKRILVVDDNSDNRMLIDAYLKNTNYTISMATNGIEAVKAYKENQFDLVLMDIQMPEMDGLQATSAIRKYESENSKIPTPIIALSAYALKEEKDKSLAAGCDLHLTKPIKKNDLINSINPFLETKISNELFKAVIDPDLKEMALNYLDQRRAELPILKDASINKDFKLLNTLGHKMRGVAESYGFAELTQFGDELEQAAKASNEAEVKQIISKIEIYLASVKITVGVTE